MEQDSKQTNPTSEKGICIDFHTHTHVSKDSRQTVEQLCKRIKSKGLDGFALTDHDSLTNFPYAKQAAKEYGLFCIKGTEIMTELGEVIAYLPTEAINLSDRCYEVICEDIRDKDGLIVIPHPYDTMRGAHLKIAQIHPSTLQKFTDGVEVINSRILCSEKPIARARKLKERLKILETGGSDGHQPREVGNGYTSIPEKYANILDEEDELRNNFKSIEFRALGKQSPFYVHFFGFMDKWAKKLNERFTGRPRMQ